MNPVEIIQKFRISFIIGIIIVFVSFIFGFWLMGITMNLNMWGFVIIFSLLIGVLIRSRKKWHQGQIPIFLGIVMISGGLVLWLGGFSYDFVDGDGGTLHHEQWWQLNYHQSGIFLLVAILGIVIFIFGGKQALQWIYGWGNIKRR